jgi:integrase
MAQPIKHPKTGIYQLRRKVPEALRKALGHEYKRSLGTREPQEAKSRFAAAWVECEQVFALARAQKGGDYVLSRQDAEQLAARWFRDEQEKLERSGNFYEVLVSGPVLVAETRYGPEEHQTYVTLADAAAEGFEIDDTEWAGFVTPYMRATLRENNIPMPEAESEAHARLFAAFSENLHKLSVWALRRQEGERQPQGVNVAAYAPVAAERKAEVSTQEIHSLSALFDAYSEDKKLTDGDTRATQRTLAAYDAIVQRFIELYGDLEVASIGRELVAKYRSALAKLPAKGVGIRGLTAPALMAKAEKERLPLLSEPTIRNRLRAVSAVMSYGVRLGWMHENAIIAGGSGRAAALAATRRQSAAKRRKDYTEQELVAIFSSPVFTDKAWAAPRAKFGQAWYWLPLLLYYTGARREELAQLKVIDVKQTDGLWHLSILATPDEDDGKRSVKTAGSRRLIPLHPDLLERGFLTYLESVPARGQLFPLLRPDPSGYYGANFGKRWAAYLRETVGLHSPASPAHGFRHTFKTLSRSVGIPEDVHDAITGHVGEGAVARDYGSMPLRRMAEEIERFPVAPTLVPV